MAKPVIDIASQLNDAVRALLPGIGQYMDLDLADKRAVRYLLYQRLGRYGKIIVPIFDDLFEAALELGDAEHGDTASDTGEGTAEDSSVDR